MFTPPLARWPEPVRKGILHGGRLSDSCAAGFLCSDKVRKALILKSLIPIFQSIPGIKGVTLIQNPEANNLHYFMGTNAGDPDKTKVNTRSELFTSQKPEDFAMLISALPHEMRHSQQFNDLMNNRGEGFDSEKANDKVLLFVPSIPAINQSSTIEPHSRFASVAQPLELQAYLLQKAVLAVILRQLGIPSGAR